jgi:hypothetical protein
MAALMFAIVMSIVFFIFILFGLYILARKLSL